MKAQIRKIVVQVDETHTEGGQAIVPATRRALAMAVIANPYAGRYSENLDELIAIGEELGALLGQKCVKALGIEPGQAQSYGKAAIVGLDGEVEHASALIHTLRFGNHYRTAVGAKTYLAFTNIRGGANTPVMIPLMDKADEGRRSHYLTVHFAIPDAPAADEIVVARRGSPIVIGLCDDETIVASDASALIAYTRQVIYLDDNDIAVVTADSIDIRDLKSLDRDAVNDLIRRLAERLEELAA